MRINMERLTADLEYYAQYGKDERGGVTRPSFSAADLEVRRLFVDELQAMGLAVTIDAAANIWARRKGSGQKHGAIVIGSHLDTVPNGGKYDGALGVLVAKEIMQTLIESDVTLSHDLEIVSFTAEESNDFGYSTFGSRAFAGRLTADQLQHARDSQGRFLADALQEAGGDLGRFAELGQLQEDKKAFLELHIEQGKRLESKNIAIAAVNTAVGIYRSKITVSGQANHSGTTMMEHRFDALAAAAEMILAVEQLCKSTLSDLVGTVGQLQVFPNAVNIVPGKVEFTLEIRGENEEEMLAVGARIRERWADIARERGIEVEQRVLQAQQPAVFDSQLVSILQETAQSLGEPCLTLASMAVHDAVHMGAITKSAMIFVKSIDGKSHCPEEYSLPEDIETVANFFLQAVLQLDRQLD